MSEVQARGAGMPFGDLLGIEVLVREKTRVVGRMTVRPELCTGGNICHGGAYMAFADSLGAIGGFLNLPPGARTTTLESKTNFLGAAPEGATITGEATPLHVGRRSSVWQTRISNEAGKLLALVTQTQLTIAD
ncbi:PaaI family thioesterase [Phenylobacterium sp.]|uniref:PaaI family thioesterase n=1 Tax=Phenylobacterium sp. TaxID=1871053 RepID=UPI002633124A|nr:PaaI family thioesterase [Phenylobacterium sp.]